MPAAERLTARVYGRVQGVGFRIYVKELADRLGIRGTVRNAPDGSVEVTAEARPSALDHLEIALHTGSPASRVDRVEVDRAPVEKRSRRKRFVVAW